MSASLTQIANAALRRLGVEKISSIDDDNKRATLLKDLYPLVRNELLESGFWNFSMKRIQLSKLGDSPDFGWSNAFALPSDYIRMYRISGSKFKGGSGHLPEFFATGFSDNPAFAIEGDKLLTDISDVFCVYSSRVTDTSQFTAGFTKALYLKLASECAYSLTQDRALTDQLAQEAQMWLMEVRSRDSMSDNDPDDQPEFSSLIAPRFM